MTVDIAQIESQALQCTRCGLSQGRTNVVWSDGNLDSDLLFVGEAPGFHEDKQGVPFVGAAGQLLDKMLAEIGLDRTQSAIVNVVKCRPPNNRDPQPEEIATCTPYLDAQIEHMKPKVIVTLGNFATKFILEEEIGITKARGQIYERRGAYVIPTFHPAAALRGGRFGGVSTMDALRADMATVRAVLDGDLPCTATEASTPEASTPEASTPEASTPEASTPEASTPEASTPEGRNDLRAVVDSHSSSSDPSEQLGLF